MAHVTTLSKAYSANTGTANTFSYSGSFDVFKESEVVVKLDGTALTYQSGTINESASPREYNVDITAKTIHVGGADLASGTLKIYPVTDMGSPTPRASFSPGSSVNSDDLNNNQLQVMRKVMEASSPSIQASNIDAAGSPGADKVLAYEGTEAQGWKWATQSGGGGGGGGGSAIEVVDESTSLTTGLKKLTFTGGGVEATEPSPDEITVTVGATAATFTDLTLRNAANDGSAVFNGTQANFTLVTSGTTNAFTPTSASSLIVSVGGVIQKPNSGTSTPAEGFALSGSTIKFGANLSTEPNFIVSQSAALAVGTPGNETVKEQHLSCNAPTNDYVLTADSTSANGFKWASVAAGTALANEATDTTCFPVFATAATDAAWSTAKSNASLAFNSATAQFSSKIVHAEIFENPTALTANYSVTASKNAHVAGPFSTGSYTLTVPSGTTFTII